MTIVALTSEHRIQRCVICDEATGTQCRYCGIPLCWWCLFCARDTGAHDPIVIHPESALT